VRAIKIEKATQEELRLECKKVVKEIHKITFRGEASSSKIKEMIKYKLDICSEIKSRA